jgi:hypothetical protein
MKQMKQTNETENLLSLIYQSGARLEVKNGLLWVDPQTVAQQFGDQIRRLKPEIVLAFGYCPVCLGELTVKVEKTSSEKTGRHAHCQQPLHYDDWKF